MAIQPDRRSLRSVADFKKGMEALGTEVSTKIGVRANRQAAKHLERKLVETAPFDPATKMRGGKDYGHLRDNIRVKRQKAVKQHHIVHLVTVGRAFWGAFLEWGTRHMAAMPWMRPTAIAEKDAVIDVQMNELGKGIERATKRLFKSRSR